MYDYDYPEEILQILRERRGMDEDDDSGDEGLNTLSPNEVFEECLEWEGICGYSHTILNFIKNIFGIELNRLPWLDELDGEEVYLKRTFVRGFGQLIAHLPQGYNHGVTAMDMDLKEQVTITYRGGGTHHANVAADSLTATMQDILKAVN